MTFWSRLSERSKVRLSSRAAALTLAALAGVLMLQFPPTTRGPPADDFSGTISVVTIMTPRRLEPARPLERRPEETDSGIVTPVEATQTDGAEGQSMTLWLDGGARRVAFTDGDHYMRCLEAALAHVDAPGCPPADRRFASNAGNGRWAAGGRVNIERQRPGRRGADCDCGPGRRQQNNPPAAPAT